ncbi:lytic transglycosylase domain-containing protein [Streptomyces sp. Tu 2975]|uniref:lytic transglycosylase domain-containing protein n=1 Tax=Streptomyces sp. Tu 2975 TaxID=2676871 RepID=UPI00135796CD|nr:lytic transglycosylase domain-containing protein [Streptomyces sp. Tu 2975]QIP83919.1 lytic transglycosylase domain-containing protein [Streptomyces sp. Tu 2975]
MTGRVGRGVKATAAAAVAVAALTASQGPGTAVPAGQRQPLPAGGPVSGDSVYRTELPPLRTPGPADIAAPGVFAAPAVGALPATVFAAYRAAEAALARSAPACGLRLQLLAAIGQVESGQARGGRVLADGTSLSPILGPRLDGNGFALIRDSDGGAYDGDTVYDRAVGPMQFIPSTWAHRGADGNGDGRADPGNIFDAALAAGRHLCAGGRDLSERSDLERAVLGYNHSAAYLRTVLAWYAYYLGGHRVVPDHRGPSAGPARSAPAAPEPRRTGVPRPAAAPSSTAEPAAIRPAARPSASPSPRPSATAPAGEPAEPLLPLPDVLPPGDGLLPGGPRGLTSNGTDSMDAGPSTSPDTGR